MNCLTWDRSELPSANLLITDWTTGNAMIEQVHGSKASVKWHLAQLDRRNAEMLPKFHKYKYTHSTKIPHSFISSFNILS